MAFFCWRKCGRCQDNTCASGVHSWKMILHWKQGPERKANCKGQKDLVWGGPNCLGEVKNHRTFYGNWHGSYVVWGFKLRWTSLYIKVIIYRLVTSLYWISSMGKIKLSTHYIFSEFQTAMLLKITMHQEGSTHRVVHRPHHRWVDGQVWQAIVCLCLGLQNTCFHPSHDGHNGRQTDHRHILLLTCN
jgi:hypothetical protein